MLPISASAAQADLRRWEYEMKRLIAITALLLLPGVLCAMQIIPPEMVLRQIINATTSQATSPGLDLPAIQKANLQHSPMYVRRLILSLKTDDLKIQKPMETDLTIRVLAPRKIDFVFEVRLGKWVDGSDYEYYIVTKIEEEISQQESGHVRK